jgi:hypothetical protein
MSCGRCYATGRPLSPPLRLDIFIEILLETVRKGLLGRWLGTLPSMIRRAYPTDLSDVEWSCLEPYLPAHAGTGRPRVHSLREILSTPSSTSFAAGVLGTCCPTTSLPGRPYPTTSGSGASTVLGSDSTQRCVTAYEYGWGEIRSPALQ